ncbi:MAG: M14 family metallopeptidase [Caldilineaceae bacterium]
MKRLLALLLGFVIALVNVTDLQSEQSELRQIGTSTNGYPIEAYRFGSGWRRVIFVGGIHGGYERNTIELAWQMIEHFRAHPALVPEAVTVEIVPVANPDGLIKVVGTLERNKVTRPAIVRDPYVGRFNGNNIDLNRNWDCQWSALAQGPRGRVSGGSAAMSEVETRALADYLADPSTVGVVFWHSSANGVYAGGCDGPFPAAERLAQSYADGSGYPLRSAFTAYSISGDGTNWLALQGIPAITIELRTQVLPEFEQNLRGVLAVLDYFSKDSTLCTSVKIGQLYAKPAPCKTWLQP